MDQAWMFFLNSYRDVHVIARAWENHEYLKNSSALQYEQKEEKNDKMSTAANSDIDFFNSLFDKLKKEGSRVVIPDEHVICDPITGESPLISVQLRKIMPSNARPLLIDCYTRTKQSNNGSSGGLQISSMLLKRGDDLRKDAAVLLMFRFMNAIWTDANLKYNEISVQVFLYSVVPMSIDFGVIEFVPDVTQIANIGKLGIELKKNNNNEMSRLIATAAASYIASYVIGVRDRFVCEGGCVCWLLFV